MRIAFFTHYAGLYGANRSLLNLIDGLRTYDVKSFVLSPYEGEVTDALYKRSVPVGVYPFEWWMSTRRWPRVARWRLQQNVKQLFPLAKQLRQWRVDLIYTNTSVIPIGAMLAKLTGRPHIWHFRELIDLDYGLQHDWGLNFFRRIVSWADAKIAISTSVRDHVLRGMDPRTVHIIYNGIASSSEFDCFRTQASGFMSTGDAYTFALVGLIHPNKGQELAIRAVRKVVERFPGAKLILVGNGETEYVEECKNLCTQLGITENVEFRGYVENSFDVYLAVDAVLMCSKHEAMGRTTVEAMAACRPVVGNNQSGTTELIAHGRTGLLYDGTVEGLSDSMMHLIENREWAQELGQNGWHAAHQKYTIENYSRQIYNVLESVHNLNGDISIMKATSPYN